MSDILVAIYNFIMDYLFGSGRRLFNSLRNKNGSPKEVARRPFKRKLLKTQNLLSPKKASVPDVESGEFCSQSEVMLRMYPFGKEPRPYPKVPKKCMSEEDLDLLARYHVDYQKIMSLEQELLEVKSMVKKILTEVTVEPKSPLTPRENGETLETSKAAPCRPPPPPPPMPPPPPPTPTPSPATYRTYKTSNSLRSGILDLDLQSKRISFGDVIREIGKVKLRPVEKTETGSPVRHPPTPQNSPNILTNVLKARLAAIQDSPSPQKCSSGLNMSPNSPFGSPNVIYL